MKKPKNDFKIKDVFEIAEVNREVFSEIAEVEDSFYPEKLNPKGDYEVSFSSVGLMPDIIKNKDINTVFNVSETDDNSETRGQYQSQIIKGKINYNIKIPRFKESDNFEDEYSKDSQVLHEYIHHLCDKDRRSFLSKKRDIKEYPQRIVFESFKKKYFADKRMKEGHPEEFIAYSVQEWYYPGGSKMPTSKLEPAFYGLPEFPNEIRRMNFSIGWLVQQTSMAEKQSLPRI